MNRFLCLTLLSKLLHNIKHYNNLIALTFCRVPTHTFTLVLFLNIKFLNFSKS